MNKNILTIVPEKGEIFYCQKIVIVEDTKFSVVIRDFGLPTHALIIIVIKKKYEKKYVSDNVLEVTGTS
jgi:hypothetical protein